VVFLATAAVDDGEMLWPERVDWAFAVTPCLEAVLPGEPAVVELSSRAARACAAARAKARLKLLPDAARRVGVDELLAALAVADHAAELPRQMLNWDEVRASPDVIRYGGHTHNHPILSRLAPADQAAEIRLCRERIIAETGKPPEYFAYPNGRTMDFDAHSRELVRETGFTLGFSTEPGVNGPDTDWLAIRRLPTTGRGLGDFAWLVAAIG